MPVYFYILTRNATSKNHREYCHRRYEEVAPHKTRPSATGRCLQWAKTFAKTIQRHAQTQTIL